MAPDKNDTTRRSTPELIREAEEAQWTTDLTIGFGEEILERIKEVARHIDGCVRAAAGPDERICERA